MEADMTCITEQLSTGFSLDGSEAEMELITLQMLRWHSPQSPPGLQNFQDLVDTQKYKGKLHSSWK